MKFDSILGTIWLDASPDALIGVSYTPIDESPLANQEILQTAKKQLLEFLAGARHKESLSTPAKLFAERLFQM